MQNNSTTKLRTLSLGKLLSFSRIILFGLVLLLGLVALTFLGVNAMIDSDYVGKIEPGVSISGVYVGETTREQAHTKVMKELETYTQKPLALSFQDKTWQPTLEQLGVSVKLDGSLDKATTFGKTGKFLSDLRLLKMVNPATLNLPIELELNEAKLNAYLTDLAQGIRKDAIEPDVKLDADGKLIVTEGKEGFNVNYDATYGAIKQSLQSLNVSSENFLEVHEVPAVISKQELDELRTSLAPLLSGPVTLSFKDKTWTLDQKQIAAQIKINRSVDRKDPRHLSYTFDSTPFEKYIAGLSKEVNQEPINAQVGWVNGKVGFTKASQTGHYLAVSRSFENLNQAFQTADPEKRKVNLEVDIRQPSMSSDNVENLGRFDLVGEGISSFVGSASERATNIKVGASYLTDTIIKPHSVFSFLDSIGEISVKQGYVKGYAIVADQTVPDVGGGICQVSTTVFRAAFFGGLPIVERNSHAYRVSWYEEMGEPVGFDAAVYQPGVDFRFENPTDYYMYVKASVEGGKLYVRIYGNKTPGQKVELVSSGIEKEFPAPPDKTVVDPTLAPGQRKQLDYAHKGLNTTITRIIKVDGKEVRRTNYKTEFQPWPNIFKIGPSVKAPDPIKPPATKTPVAPTKAPVKAPAPLPTAKS